MEKTQFDLSFWTKCYPSPVVRAQKRWNSSLSSSVNIILWYLTYSDLIVIEFFFISILLDFKMNKMYMCTFSLTF